MPLTASERLELLETWSRRSFTAMTVCAVLLGLMLVHMVYAQISIANYRVLLEARATKSERESEESNKAFAEAQAKSEARLAQNQKNLDDLKKAQAQQSRNFTPDARLDPAEEKKESE